jgi:phosphoribosylglycinamide formyltransferase 1
MPNNPRKSLQPLRIAVLASGEGATLQALLDAIVADELAAQVVCVVSNNSEAGALRRARLAGIPVLHLSATTHPNPTDLDAALTAALQEAETEVVVTAGYMKRLGPLVMETFKGCMINVHPSLLPKFGGKGMFDRHVHEAVLAAGESESGASVHFVEGDYDTGRVIAQVRIPVLADDTVGTLAERVKLRERLLLVEVLHRRALDGHFEGCSRADVKT